VNFVDQASIILALASGFIIRYRMICSTDGSLKIWDWITRKQGLHPWLKIKVCFYWENFKC
jgi:hypothetical protein